MEKWAMHLRTFPITQQSIFIGIFKKPYAMKLVFVEISCEKSTFWEKKITKSCYLIIFPRAFFIKKEGILIDGVFKINLDKKDYHLKEKLLYFPLNNSEDLLDKPRFDIQSEKGL